LIGSRGDRYRAAMRRVFVCALFAALLLPALAAGTSYVPRPSYAEPNGLLGDAFGPLRTGRPYSSYAGGDGDVDSFYFVTTGAQEVSISVSNDGTGLDTRCRPLLVTVTWQDQVVATREIPTLSRDTIVVSSSWRSGYFVSLAAEPAAEGCRELYPYTLQVTSSAPLAAPNPGCARAIADLRKQLDKRSGQRRALRHAHTRAARRRLKHKLDRQDRVVAQSHAARRVRCRAPLYFRID
jgi:hypothetical protein